MINTVTSILGLAIIAAAGASPYLIENTSWWSVLGGILGGSFLVWFKKDGAQKFMNKILDKWNGSK